MVGIGEPLAVTVNVQAIPVWHDWLLGLVMAGACPGGPLLAGG
jgi:hypothetical protein